MEIAEGEEVLTLAEVTQRYDAEWVLMVDPEVDANMEVLRGRVIAHSKSRDEVARKDLELRLRSAAYVYTGTMPENTAIIL